jgi:transcriptional regulator with XRE-family HTH domain
MPPAKDLDPTASLEAYLGATIRRRREEKGLTQRQLGQMVFVAHTRIAQIELATDPAGLELIKLLDTALDAKEELVNLWKHIHEPGTRDYAKTFLLRQMQARMIQEYSVIIPGLAQTEEYMRVMFAAGLSGIPFEQRLAVRLGRQARLNGDNPPWYRLVLHEAALLHGVGGPAVMGRQLERLLEMNRRRTVDVHVVPFGAADLNVLNGSFCLLTMEDGSRSAYTEGIGMGQFFEQPQDVTRMAVFYDRVLASALDPEMSAAFIRNVMEERYSWGLPPLS